MGQIWDFLRSVSVHFGAPRQNVLKQIFKSPRFVPFGANLTKFGNNIWQPYPEQLFVTEENKDVLGELIVSKSIVNSNTLLHYTRIGLQNFIVYIWKGFFLSLYRCLSHNRSFNNASTIFPASEPRVRSFRTELFRGTNVSIFLSAPPNPDLLY